MAEFNPKMALWTLFFALPMIAYGQGFLPEPIRKVDVLCSLDEDLCGESCYNPETQACLETSNGYSKRVCGKGEAICGWKCYDPSSTSKECQGQGQGELPTLCDEGQLSCLGSCYSPETHDCAQGPNPGSSKALCPKGQVPCGYNNCHDPSSTEQKCLDTDWGSSYLCGSHEELCGSWGCYDPKKQTCFKDKDYLCSIGDELCGYNCYKPQEGQTCHGELICKAGEVPCGESSCYDPQGDHVCLNSTRVCKKGQVLCGDRDCYDPEEEGTRCFEARDDYHVVCTGGKQYCHYNCFDPKSQVCLETTLEDYRLVCPLGSGVCNGALSPNTWGYGCYSPDKEVCIERGEEGEGKGKTLCKEGQGACGVNCYDPQGGKVCLGDSILCEVGEEACGGICYEPAKRKCFRDIVSEIQWGG